MSITKAELQEECNELKKQIESLSEWIKEKILSEFPPISIVREGDLGPFCAICGSSLYKKHWGSRRSSNCIQPECNNYHKISE